MADTKAERESALNTWAKKALAGRFEVPDDFALVAASDDASFRRYFRGEPGDRSFIFVDAPPELEDSKSFVVVAKLLREEGVNAPVVIEHDLNKGFMMLTDFGDELFESALIEGDKVRIDSLYDAAAKALLKMQRIRGDLPRYDERRLRDEMSLFTEWFLPQQLEITLDDDEQELIDRVMNRMVESALEQPQRFVHRDYHCRNLMIVADNNPGVIDFQDAVMGPVTYDLVSLLRDCYHRFDDAFIDQRVESFRVASGHADVDQATFRRWFDYMGMQRHLKVAGIFSRLNLRDGKPRYLADIPLVVDYLCDVASSHEELCAFADWLEHRIQPRMPELLNA